MPAVSAILENSAEHGATGEVTEAGGTATRFWRVLLVDTDDYREALGAPGLPQPPAPYNEALPTLRLRRLGVDSIIGAVRAGSDGHTYATVRVRGDYSTPSVGGSSGGAIPQEDRTPGKAYSRWEFNEASRNVTADVTGAPLVNPDGADVLDSGLEIHITAFLTAPPSLIELNKLLKPNKINENRFNLPPLYGNGVIYVVERGSALFLAPKCDFVLGSSNQIVTQMTYRLLIAEDWRERAQRRNTDGQPVGPIIEQDIYQEEEFKVALLWNGVPIS